MPQFIITMRTDKVKKTGALQEVSALWDLQGELHVIASCYHAYVIEPIEPHFYKVKLRFIGVYCLHYFPYFFSKTNFQCSLELPQ